MRKKLVIIRRKKSSILCIIKDILSEKPKESRIFKEMYPKVELVKLLKVLEKYPKLKVVMNLKCLLELL